MDTKKKKYFSTSFINRFFKNYDINVKNDKTTTLIG